MRCTATSPSQPPNSRPRGKPFLITRCASHDFRLPSASFANNNDKYCGTKAESAVVSMPMSSSMANSDRKLRVLKKMTTADFHSWSSSWPTSTHDAVVGILLFILLDRRDGLVLLGETDDRREPGVRSPLVQRVLCARGGDSEFKVSSSGCVSLPGEV